MGDLSFPIVAVAILLLLSLAISEMTIINFQVKQAIKGYQAPFSVLGSLV
jgi:hypothetical protein